MDWIVTNDPDYQKQYTGRYEGGFHNCSKFPRIKELDEIAAALPYEFKILDDDDNLMYGGKCGDLAEAEELDAFEALDWATDEAGATEFQYRKTGETKWQIL